MNDRSGHMSSDSLNSSVSGEDGLISGGLLQDSFQDEAAETLRKEIKELQQTLQSKDAHIERLETELCKLRNGFRPQPNEEDEEWQQMHSHCTSKTCWRQMHAEALMQMAAALRQAKSDLETLSSKKPNEVAARLAELRMIEESLRSLGPIAPPPAPPVRSGITKNVKRPSASAAIHHFKSPSLVTSESRTSLGRRPFLKRVISIFRRNNQSTSA